MTLALAERLSRLSYEADATDAERLMTDAEFDEWLDRQREIMDPAQILSDALNSMNAMDVSTALALTQSPVHSPTLARIFRNALRRECARECASLADGLRLINAFQDGLKRVDDVIAEDRRALAREHNRSVR